VNDNTVVVMISVLLLFMIMCKLCYCVANNFLCSCVYDCVCMDHKSEIN